ncbi:MAG: adenylate/guanylate cyclase domain-containing protein, partial [Verrucomicrobiota bacterium]
EKVDISIMFTDIQGFSTFSEQLEPEELVELMVEYLSELTDIITDYGGTLDKYIGDAIDAMFGAPLPLDDHAHVSVMTAIEIQRKQAELREKWKKEGRPDLVQEMRTRVGLNTGAAVVGNMGSTRRFNYTMMGDNVNLGARCESGAKAYGVYTMITGDTYSAARESKDDITYRFLDQIVVKGRTLPVKVYEVVETNNNITTETKDCLKHYADGMNLYLAQKWDDAIATFEKSAALEPYQPDRDPGVHTNPSQVMIARCGMMQVSPPPADWDGVFTMVSK